MIHNMMLCNLVLIYLIKISIISIFNININNEIITSIFLINIVFTREIILLTKEDLNTLSDDFIFFNENIMFVYKKNDTMVLCTCNHDSSINGIKCRENVEYIHFKLRKIVISNPDESLLNSIVIRKINDDLSMPNIIILDNYCYSEAKMFLKYLKNIDLPISDIGVPQFSRIIKFINELNFIDGKSINYLLSFIVFHTFIFKKETLKYDLKNLENRENEYFSVSFILKIFKHCFKFYFCNIEAIEKTLGKNTESKDSLYTKLINYHNKNQIPMIFSKDTLNLLYKILTNRNLYNIVVFLFNRLNIRYLIIYGDNLYSLLPCNILLEILPSQINKCTIIIGEECIETVINYFKMFFNRASLKKLEVKTYYLTERVIEAFCDLHNLDFLRIYIFESNNVILNSVLGLLDKLKTVFVELILKNMDFQDISNINIYKLFGHPLERIYFGFFSRELRNLKKKFKKIEKMHLITHLNIYIDENCIKFEKLITKFVSLKTLSIKFLYKNQFFIKSKFMFLSQLDKLKDISMTNIRINNNLLKFILLSKTLKRVYLKNSKFSTKINFLKYERQNNYTLEEFNLDRTENIPNGFFSRYLNYFFSIYFANIEIIETTKSIMKVTLVMFNFYESFKVDSNNISQEKYAFFPRKIQLSKVFFNSELFEKIFMIKWNIIYLEEVYIKDLKMNRVSIRYFSEMQILTKISLHSIIFVDSNFSDIFYQTSYLSIQVIMLSNIEIHEIDIRRLNNLRNLKILNLKFCNFSTKPENILKYSQLRTLTGFNYRGYLFYKKLRTVFNENFSMNILTS